MKARTPRLLVDAKKKVEPLLAKVVERIAKPITSDGPEGAHLVPSSLDEAMRYALLSPGKRLRPALVLGGAKAVGGKPSDAYAAACAVEMIHAYSLIHDDLPCLDDADERRGKPSLHKAFDEATALLAGDALLTEAFALVADPRPLGRGEPKPKARALATFELARAAGAGGMVGGQVDDVLGLGKRLSSAELWPIHRRKTGRLIQAAVTIGGICGGGAPRDLDRLRKYGAEVGLAFQLVDDLLDNDGVVTTLGRETTMRAADDATTLALEALAPFGKKANGLVELALTMMQRTA
jgi:geranylgeranyl pyrophosphate synthase